jgi:ribokinase
MAGRIIVAGSLNMDLVVRSPRHPKPGETLLGGDFHTFPGGKGANQAVAAARVGAMTSMIGRVGKDAFGDALLGNLRQNGVETKHVTQEGNASGVALITVSDDGQNTIVVAQGANALLSTEDIDRAIELFTPGSVLLTQLEVPIATITHAVEVAKAHGVTVVLNPAPAQSLDKSLLAMADYLVPNQHELALLTGEDDVDAGVEALRSLGVRSVLVTLGGEGSLLVSETTRLQTPAYRVKAVDTTAAGDAFVGAFGAALAAGNSTSEAVRWGTAAGAIAVTRTGAQPSLPTRAEVEALLAKVD